MRTDGPERRQNERRCEECVEVVLLHGEVKAVNTALAEFHLRYERERNEESARRESWRTEVTTKLDEMNSVISEIAPSVTMGRKIFWSVVGAVGSTLIGGLFYGAWNLIIHLSKHL